MGATPLHRAAGPGNLAAVTALLAADAALVDVKDKYGNTALHYACEEERTEVARLLLKARSIHTCGEGRDLLSFSFGT